MSKKFIVEYATGTKPEIPGYILEEREYIAPTGIHHTGYMIEIETLEQFLEVCGLIHSSVIISGGNFSGSLEALNNNRNISAVLTGYDDYIE